MILLNKPNILRQMFHAILINLLESRMKTFNAGNTMRIFKQFLFALASVTILLLTSLNSCIDKNRDSEKTKSSVSATVEELGQMNRDFAKALAAKDAAATAIVYDENAQYFI